MNISQLLQVKGQMLRALTIHSQIHRRYLLEMYLEPGFHCECIRAYVHLHVEQHTFFCRLIWVGQVCILRCMTGVFFILSGLLFVFCPLNFGLSAPVLASSELHMQICRLHLQDPVFFRHFGVGLFIVLDAVIVLVWSFSHYCFCGLLTQYRR